MEFKVGNKVCGISNTGKRFNYGVVVAGTKDNFFNSSSCLVTFGRDGVLNERGLLSRNSITEWCCLEDLKPFKEAKKLPLKKSRKN